MSSDGDEEITLPEAARRFNYSHQHLWERVKAGELPARKVNGAYLVRVANMRRFVNRPRRRSRLNLFIDFEDRLGELEARIKRLEELQYARPLERSQVAV